MRFLLNFFLFGILFYLIYIFFPDAFHTLVSWANAVYNFIHDAVMSLVNWSNEKKTPSHEEGKAVSAMLSLAGLKLFARF